MQLPEMTALQFLVVHLLLRGEKSGKKLAEALAALGVQHSQPAFSRLMGRMMATERPATRSSGGRSERSLGGSWTRTWRPPADDGTDGSRSRQTSGKPHPA